MFTPPPSPVAVIPAGFSRAPHGVKPESIKNSATPPASPNQIKRRIGRRIKLTAILIPLALILVTASCHYLTHPIIFDILAGSPPSLDWPTVSVGLTSWRPHKRHPGVELNNAPPPTSISSASSPPGFAGSVPSPTIGFPTSASGSPSSVDGSPSPVGGSPTSVGSSPPSAGGTPSSATSPSSPTSTTAQSIPTIPATPPVLPTPFPQPFDSDVTQNFSSATCFNFFNNMTNNLPFRSCRPFSLLLQSSNEFIEAQENLTTLNSIVWGTCNTTLSQDQCVSNMAWFAMTLRTACAQDLTDKNTMAVNTLIALDVYKLMRSAGCLQDPSTNRYCYMNAVTNSNPADQYFYQLPLGTNLSINVHPTCSPCTKTLMASYVEALGNSTESETLVGLKKTYNGAEQVAVRDCGPGYALPVTSSAVVVIGNLKDAGMLVGLTLLMGWWSALGFLL